MVAELGPILCGICGTEFGRANRFDHTFVSWRDGAAARCGEVRGSRRGRVSGPHGERSGIEVEVLEYVGRRGWAVRGLADYSGPVVWEWWRPQLADRWLQDMGWVRVGDWVEGGGIYFAEVLPASR